MRPAALLMAALCALPATGMAEVDPPPLPPDARQVAGTGESPGAVRLPVTPWQAGEVQGIRAEGAVRRRVWQIPRPGLTTAQLMAPIRAALEEAGYAVLLACEAAECGGFEFRFATDALPAPEMYVDLGDYRYLAAQRSSPEGERWRAVMVSVTPERGFVQVTSVDPVEQAPPPDVEPSETPPRPDGLASALEAGGSAVLWDLAFETGAAALGPGPFASLEALAGWLSERPAARVALVGHTDTEGGLAPNVELSRQRADAVRARLVERYGIAAERLSAEGVSYLAPRDSNATEAGRERNRRVEVVLVEGP